LHLFTDRIHDGISTNDQRGNPIDPAIQVNGCVGGNMLANYTKQLQVTLNILGGTQFQRCGGFATGISQNGAR
jgi:hypothetical protein